MDEIRVYLRENGLSKTNDIAKYISLSVARTRVILSQMDDLEVFSTNTNRKYK